MSVGREGGAVVTRGVLLRLLGTGIRLEDNVLVTDGDAEVLNRNCPETLEELNELIPIT